MADPLAKREAVKHRVKSNDSPGRLSFRSSIRQLCRLTPCASDRPAWPAWITYASHPSARAGIAPHSMASRLKALPPCAVGPVAAVYVPPLKQAACAGSVSRAATMSRTCRAARSPRRGRLRLQRSGETRCLHPLNGRRSEGGRATISRMIGLPPGYVERAIARALAQAYPWLITVEKPHDGGMLAPAPPWLPDVANDPQWVDS